MVWSRFLIRRPQPRRPHPRPQAPLPRRFPLKISGLAMISCRNRSEIMHISRYVATRSVWAIWICTSSVCVFERIHVTSLVGEMISPACWMMFTWWLEGDKSLLLLVLVDSPAKGSDAESSAKASGLSLKTSRGFQCKFRFYVWQYMIPHHALPGTMS